jgi:predicted nucleic acid-binding protein
LLQHLSASDFAIAVPSQVASEAMSQIRRAVASGTTPVSEGDILLEELRSLLAHIDLVQWGAFALAARFDRPTTYDCEPYALAESLGADFWTADDRFVNAMQGERPPWVHRLSDFQPTSTT